MFKNIFIAVSFSFCLTAMDNAPLETIDAQYIRKAFHLRDVRMESYASAEESILCEANEAIQNYIATTGVAPYNIPFLRWVTLSIMNFSAIPDPEWDETSFSQTETWFAYAPNRFQETLLSTMEKSIKGLN